MAYSGFRQVIAIKSLLLTTLAVASQGNAQSLNVHAPGPMSAGVNTATIDSFNGSQYWIFTATPGTFKLVWSFGSSQEGFKVGTKPAMAAIYFPKTAGSTLTYKELPNSTIFTGVVKEPTKVLIEVDPAKSPLVRQTTAYALEATGNVSFTAATTNKAPSVAGIYAVNIFGEGIAKFAANGEITSTTGTTGRWELFDADSKTYAVTFGGKRYSVTFQPDRGFVDNNGQLVFTLKQ